MTDLPALPPRHLIDDLLTAALAEDLGGAGDITSAYLVPEHATSKADLVAREDGVLAGLGIGLRAFELVDASVQVTVLAADGDRIRAGTAVAEVSGPSRAILAAERTGLNVIGHLSGIASATRRLSDAIAHTNAVVVDTRKTTPGLRALEKYAVTAGGGANHRFGLFDAVLIKDNHIAVVGGVGEAAKRAREAAGHMVKVEVEIDDPSQLEAAISAGADIVLLDNMTPAQLSEAVVAAAGRCLLEASGGITPDTIVGVAETGVDLISVGWITHSAPRWDVALEFE